jgi:hypothetical protein
MQTPSELQQDEPPLEDGIKRAARWTRSARVTRLRHSTRGDGDAASGTAESESGRQCNIFSRWGRESAKNTLEYTVSRWQIKASREEYWIFAESGAERSSGQPPMQSLGPSRKHQFCAGISRHGIRPEGHAHLQICDDVGMHHGLSS